MRRRRRWAAQPKRRTCPRTRDTLKRLFSVLGELLPIMLLMFWAVWSAMTTIIAFADNKPLSEVIWSALWTCLIVLGVVLDLTWKRRQVRREEAMFGDAVSRMIGQARHDFQDRYDL